REKLPRVAPVSSRRKSRRSAPALTSQTLWRTPSKGISRQAGPGSAPRAPVADSKSAAAARISLSAIIFPRRCIPCILIPGDKVALHALIREKTAGFVQTIKGFVQAEAQIGRIFQRQLFADQ